jgi:hypothetical protein
MTVTAIIMLLVDEYKIWDKDKVVVATMGWGEEDKTRKSKKLVGELLLSLLYYSSYPIHGNNEGYANINKSDWSLTKKI